MNKTVLVADDSLFMRAMLKNILRENGYRVIIEASNGMEAIEKYKEFHPDFILLDITMPLLSGLSALKVIHRFNPSANVIMCSALGQQSLIQESLQHGAKDFVIKPYFEKLSTVLQSIQ